MECFILPSGIQAIPVIELHNNGPPMVIQDSIKTTKTGEELRLYHAQLDLLESIYNPDQSDFDWQVEDIQDMANKEA